MPALRVVARTIGTLLLVMLAVPLLWKLCTNDFYVTVRGHSMEPTYHVGDILVVKRPDGTELKHPGRVVVATLGSGKNAPSYVHRVERPTDSGAWLRGDHNATHDPTPITQDHVLGAPRLALTGAWGLLFAAVQSWPIRVLIAVLGLGLLLVPIRPRGSATAEESADSGSGEDGPPDESAPDDEVADATTELESWWER